MKERGWDKKAARQNNQTPGQKAAQERLEQREVRIYESSHVHALWHLDFHKAWRNVVDSKGKWHVAHVLAILDDRSRVCNHIQWCHHGLFINKSSNNVSHAVKVQHETWDVGIFCQAMALQKPDFSSKFSLWRRPCSFHIRYHYIPRVGVRTSLPAWAH